MPLASVMASGHGATERLLTGVVARLKDDGVRVAGALRAASVGAGTAHCDSDLFLLPDGPLVRITQNLGAGSSACRMDAGALEERSRRQRMGHGYHPGMTTGGRSLGRSAS